MPKNTKSAGKKNLTISRQVKKIANRIVSRFSPDKIILFGSYAKGTAGPDSDLDLLVIMPVSGSRRDKAIEIGVALHDIAIAKDLIVVTPQEFEWRKDIVGTIERPAAREGKVLYARK
jgi:predicted nucleotidyltransferase